MKSSTRCGSGTRLFLMLLLPLFFVSGTYAQTQLEPWGNIKGIRIEGQLMEFESGLSLVSNGYINATGKERQRPKYTRDGNKQTVNSRLDSLYFTEEVEDMGTGIAKVHVIFTAHADKMLTGIFFSLLLPGADYAGASFESDNHKLLLQDSVNIISTQIKCSAGRRQLQVSCGEQTEVLAKKQGNDIRLYFSLTTDEVKKDQVIEKTFLIKASGEVDKRPVALTLDAKQTGRSFDGFGGNFRLQNPKTDPPVIDYCLENLRVAWGRVEMPWRFWQPEKDSSPIDSAKAGKLNPFVKKAMEMAQRLNNLHIPLILSAWSGPNWAIDGPPRFRPGPDGVWGNPLNPNNMQEIYKSIADYILYLHQQYGVDIKLFSFNESDIGINIRLTGQQHTALIKGMGAYFASRGLSTKMLLGDNSDATSYSFIYPAMADTEAVKYMGAVSFHSWRGFETPTLQKWADAATKLNLPLLVAEGSIDAAAWNYPAIFEESSYAIDEIKLYVRLLAICQPASILQWQLTADYSPLAGGGIFGNDAPLHPTQRFWNLKQLASTPAGLKAMPLMGTGPDIYAAALGDDQKNVFAFHLVNNGAARELRINGIPASVKSFRIFTTNKTASMQQGRDVVVSHGQIRCMLDATSYVSLISNPE